MRAALALTALFLCAVLFATGGTAQDVKKFIRFDDGGTPAYGEVADGTVHVLDGDFLQDGKRTGRALALDDVKLLAPVVPSKIIGIALNYSSHGGGAGPPGYFAKPPSALIGPGDAIVAPADSTSLHYEGELVVVIGKRARHVSRAEAAAYVFGVTAGNDVTERGYPFSPFEVLRIKGQDTFAPLGPMVVTGLAYDDLGLETRLNGETVQQNRTSKLITDVAGIIAHLSRAMTLEPGDLIYTGTPGTTRAMKPGDEVAVTIEGVGTLVNTMRAGP